MNKSNILVSFFVGAMLGVGVTFFVMNDDKDIVKEVVENDAGKEDSKKEFVSTVDVYGGWEYTALSEEIDEWKRGDEMFEERLLQEVIQDMAHQKIIAFEKEGSIMITPKRIDTLIQMVEDNEAKYEHSDKYLELLGRWRKGDFTIADVDHNIMMQIQGSRTGHEGRATGLASEEQEIDYIVRVFGKSVDKVFNSSTLKEYENEEENDNLEVIEEERDLSWVDDVHAEMLDEWKSGDLTFDERLVQEVMIHMLHQKGEINEDGSIELTPERTNKLIQIIKEDEVIFTHYEKYLDILNRWKRNDFSTIAKDHEFLHYLYDR